MLPGVHGGFWPVAGAVHLHEGMSGSLVGVELIGLAVRLERRLQFRDVLRRRVLVFRAEQAEQRAGQVPGPVDQGRDAVQRMPFGCSLDDEAAVAVHGGVEWQADRGEERLAAARAVADHADLAVGVTQPAQVSRRARHFADDPLVGDGDRARGPGRRHRVVRGRARRLTVVKVRHHRVEPARGERPGKLRGLPVVTGQVVDDHHAADAIGGCGPERPRRVRLDLVAAVPDDRHAFGQHRVVHRRSSHRHRLPSLPTTVITGSP